MHQARQKHPWDYVEDRPGIPRLVVSACLALKPDSAVASDAPTQRDFVELARGEFTACEYALRQFAYSVEPSELPLSLREDGYWRDWGYLAVAKFLHVQITLWLDDGWQVPSRVRRALVQRALQLHEAGVAMAGTGGALC